MQASAGRPAGSERVSLLAVASPVIGLVPYVLVAVAVGPVAAISAGVPGPAGLLVWLIVPVLNLFGGDPGILLLWLLAAIAAIATGHIARHLTRSSGQGGRALAGTGLFLGYGSLALLMLGFLAVIWLQYATDF
jgi:hypothetical protein